MRITSLFYLLTLAATPLSGALFYVSQEEPVAPHFAARGFNKKSSTFSFAATNTEGRLSYNGTGSKVPFFDQYGTPQIAQFCNGVPLRSGSLSEHYFSTDETFTESLTRTTEDGDGSSGHPFIPVNTTLSFNDPYNYYRLQSFHFAYTHYLFSGIFFRFNLQLIDQAIAQKPLALGQDNSTTRVTSFLNRFDQFLGEHKHPAVSYNKRSLEIERTGYFLGWHGGTLLTDNFIQEINGTILAGYTFKPTHFEHPLAPAFLPHNQTHGYSAEIDLTAQVTKHIGVEVCAATTSYGRYADSMNVVRDDTSTSTYFSGPPLIGTGKVLKDPGTLWVLETSVSANRFFGFFVTGGYHFTYQELTQLTLQDATILQNSGLSESPGKQNTRLNSDPRLALWKNHTVFVRVGFAPSDAHRFIPEFDFGIYWPVMGQHSSSPTRIYTGSGQLSIRWTF